MLGVECEVVGGPAERVMAPHASERLSQSIGAPDGVEPTRRGVAQEASDLFYAVAGFHIRKRIVPIYRSVFPYRMHMRHRESYVRLDAKHTEQFLNVVQREKIIMGYPEKELSFGGG